MLASQQPAFHACSASRMDALLTLPLFPAARQPRRQTGISPSSPGAFERLVCYSAANPSQPGGQPRLSVVQKQFRVLFQEGKVSSGGKAFTHPCPGSAPGGWTLPVLKSNPSVPALCPSAALCSFPQQIWPCSIALQSVKACTSSLLQIFPHGPTGILYGSLRGCCQSR